MYLAWFINNKVSAMGAYVKLLPITLLLTMAAPIAFSQAEWGASIAGQVNSGDPITSRITPTVTFNYVHSKVALQSSASTALESANDFIPDSWQSNNQLLWRTESNRLSGMLGYAHSEAESAESSTVTITDNASGQVSLNIPQSPTLRHQFSVSSLYREINQSIESSGSSQVSDRSETYSYSLILAASPRVSWQGGAQWRASTSGQRVASVNASRTFQTPNYSINIAGAFNQTEIEDTTAESFTGSAAYLYSHSKFTFNTAVSRSITDTIDVFTIAGLDRTFEQVQYVQADQIQFGLTNIKPTDSITLAMNYSIGQTNSLIEIESFSQDTDVSFEQWSAQSTFSFANNAQVTLQVSDSKQEESHSQSLTASIQKVLGSHWTTSASLREDLLNDTDLSWVLSLNYRL
ncbi:hypothetical protein ACFOND_08225 [Reinekea marina]|uniref:Beta-barrel porin 2 n=2 Tax=Reinekea marina TaxID=1310421 RepID=A0ABV7WTA9_9GAMM